MKSVVVLGSTGTIGINTLNLVRNFPDHFRVRGLVAGRNLKLFASQIREFSPEWVSIKEEGDVPKLSALLGRKKVELLWGESGSVKVATASGVDVIVAAIVGGAGLIPVLEGVRSGKEIALANKEAMVMAGEVLVREAKKAGVRIVPVDSEHSAIFQCLQGNHPVEVDRVLLTASGGPFLRTPLRDLKRVTLAQALKHPNWKMGPKITVDSATMMNKGLEVIEARWLFDMPPSRVEVVIHPQSVIHSMVRYQDGSIMAQLGIPDMRIPIAYALSCPSRLKLNLEPLELTKQNGLTFFPVDKRRYPALGLAYQALSSGGTMPVTLNAANEVAVAAFLEKRIRFLDVHRVVAKTMSAHAAKSAQDVHEILEVDRWAREKAAHWVEKAEGV